MASNYEKAKAAVALGPIATAQAIEKLEGTIKELQLIYNARIKMLEDKVDQLQAQITANK